MDNKYYIDILSELADKARSENMLDKAATIKRSEVFFNPASVIVKAEICDDKKLTTVVLKKFLSIETYAIENEVSKNFELSEKFKDEKYLHVPRILTVSAVKGAILYEYIKGPSLYNCVVNMTIPPMFLFMKNRLICSVKLAMKWLKVAQMSNISDVSIGEVLEKEFSDIRHRLEMLKASNGDFDDKFCNKILKMLEHNVANIARSKVSWSHNDFTLTNIIYNDSGIYVLDLSGNKEGHPYQDIVRFWQYLENIKTGYMFRENAIDSLKSAFLSGSDSAIDINSPEFIFYRAKCILTELHSYKVLLEKLPRFRRIYKNYYYPQLESLKNMVDHYG